MENRIWYTIPQTNNLYEASLCGEIRRVPGLIKNNQKGGLRKVGGKPLSAKTKKNGYKEVNLYITPQVSKMAYVHRLVVSAILGDIPEGFEVNHKDGNKSNNRFSNLELTTPSENRIHSVQILNNKAPIFKGEKHGMSKLSEDDVKSIRKMHSDGFSPRKIKPHFNVSYGTICNVCYRNTWKHIF